MVKEFMLYIRNAGNAKAALTPEEHLEFVQECEVYIGELKSRKKLVGAQPILREGYVISKSGAGWTNLAQRSVSRSGGRPMADKTQRLIGDPTAGLAGD